MDGIVALRPFVPARDFALSRRFYCALGFSPIHDADIITIFSAGVFSFILQDFYVAALAGNFMLQLLVDDVEAWWRDHDPDRLVADFAVKPPRAPAIQPWGLKVGFIIDPSGVLWHIAEDAA